MVTSSSGPSSCLANACCSSCVEHCQAAKCRASHPALTVSSYLTHTAHAWQRCSKMMGSACTKSDRMTRNIPCNASVCVLSSWSVMYHMLLIFAWKLLPRSSLLLQVHSGSKHFQYPTHKPYYQAKSPHARQSVCRSSWSLHGASEAHAGCALAILLFA